MNEKVLLIDDEESIVSVLSYALKKEGFIIEKAYDGQEALDKIKNFKPDIIILDLMLPVINGYDICKKIESENIGIIMLTAKDDIVDKVIGLELGADDYLTKPFDIREIIARVKALSRRFKKVSSPKDDSNSNGNVITIDKLILDAKQHMVTIDGMQIDFALKEFELLYLLLANINIVFSRDQLLNEIWNMDYLGGTRTVDTHIQRIRKKLGVKYQNLIATVHGIGYKGVDALENRDKV